MIPIPSQRWLLGAATLALVGLAGLLWRDAFSLLVLLDAVWVAAFALDAWLAGRALPVDVTREPPPAFSVGRPLPVRYRWRHAGSRPVVALVREALPPPLGVATPVRRLVLPPAADTVEDLLLAPIRRGKGTGGTVYLRLLGPLGLAWRPLRLARPWLATVFPTLIGASARALPPDASRRREAGLRAVRRRGEGRLFEGLREWVPGDDTRIIDWKATARRGKPIARTYEDERREQVLIMIDAGRLLTAEVDGVPRLEAVVDAALRLAHAAVEHDDNVGVMVFADEVQSFVPPSRGRRALRNVLEALAAAEGRLAESDYPAAFRELALRNRRRALTVVFTDVIDRTASGALLAHAGTLRPRHVPVAVTLRDPALERAAQHRPAATAAAFERAAAEELLRARDDALADMRRRGILVLDVSPAGAADAVVEQYEQLKRRGVL
ncbi:MAG TPA: DUF58 domain-containing protein [Gemmatimonadales bacterium]|nr:DUF58 domain-containing protein [Gemmatimonadales bacterium]